jgi:hypothetical protein
MEIQTQPRNSKIFRELTILLGTLRNELHMTLWGTVHMNIWNPLEVLVQVAMLVMGDQEEEGECMLTQKIYFESFLEVDEVLVLQQEEEDQEGEEISRALYLNRCLEAQLALAAAPEEATPSRPPWPSALKNQSKAAAK